MNKKNRAWISRLVRCKIISVDVISYLHMNHLDLSERKKKHFDGELDIKNVTNSVVSLTPP